MISRSTTKKVAPGLYKIKIELKTYYIKTEIFDISSEKFVEYLNRIAKPSNPLGVSFLGTWRYDSCNRVFIYGNGIEIENLRDREIPEIMGIKQGSGWINVIDHKIMGERIRGERNDGLELDFDFNIY